jgi:hypothetical protein
MWAAGEIADKSEEYANDFIMVVRPYNQAQKKKADAAAKAVEEEKDPAAKAGKGAEAINE